MITNGLNLVAWMDNLSKPQTRTKEWLSGSNIALMRAGGFETFRVPLDPTVLTFGSFTHWDTELRAIMVDRITAMLGAGATVVLNAWKYGAGTDIMKRVALGTSAEFWSYLDLIGELCSEFQEAVSSRRLVVDLIDETGPVNMPEAELIDAFTDTCLKAVVSLRDFAPGLKVGLPVHKWHATAELEKIAPIYKSKLGHLDRVFLVGQFWEPWSYTHAEKGTSAKWPPPGGFDMDAAMKRIKHGAKGLPIMLSGCGVARWGTDEAGANRYLRELTRSANKHGIGWNIWTGYSNVWEGEGPNKDFGLYDRKREKGFELSPVPGRVSAVELYREPEPPPITPEPKGCLMALLGLPLLTR